jgi:hypothetical protein
METLNHLLGTCGELHPNLFTVSFILLIGLYCVRQFKTKTFK